MKIYFTLFAILASVFQVACAQEQTASPTVKIDSTPIKSEISGLPTSYAEPLAKATPSVVSVFTTKIMRKQNGVNPREEMLRRFFGYPPSPNQPEPEERSVPAGVGSGVIISSNGYILTNNHVVTGRDGEPADGIIVQLQDGRELSAEIVGRDPQTDVAVIKVDTEDLPAITLADSENLRVGDIIFAIGNPLDVGLTVSSGIVSALGRSDLQILGRSGYENFIQVDAPINMGNSGGALVDAQGRLVGINTAIVSRTGGSIGIGFAIPINIAHKVMTSLVETGEVARGYLGVIPKDLDADLAEAFGLDRTKGALIDFVQEGTPADKYGIKVGDIMLEVNGKEVSSASQFRVFISQNSPGSEVELSAIRKGKPITLKVVLGDLNGAIDENGNSMIGSSSTPNKNESYGIKVEILNQNLARQFEISDRIDSGVVITKISNPNVSRDLTVGMVIQRLNDQEITTVEDFENAIQVGLNKAYFSLKSYSGFLTFRIKE